MNMDKYFMWIHYERLHNHNKAKHNKPCAYFLGYTVGYESSGEQEFEENNRNIVGYPRDYD